MRLQGKVALITGAGMGQGREACLLFSEEGAQIIALEVTQAALDETVRLVEGKGGRIIGCRADVSVEAEVREAVEKGYNEFKRLDVIYNNAGVLWRDRDKSVVEISEEDWDRVMAINLKGVLYVLKWCIPKLMATGGSIINIGSIQALLGSLPPQDAYSASKGAIISLTKSVAMQYAAYNIRANVIHPGPIATPMQAEKMKDPAWVEAVTAAIPLKRMGQPRDIAYAALFLASDESSFITGTELIVDGGMMANLP